MKGLADAANRTMSRSELQRTRKPNKSFTKMIMEVLLDDPVREMYLADIYNGMIRKFPFYATCKIGWKVKHIQTDADKCRIR